MNTKCRVCRNYLYGVDRCKYCQFEYDDLAHLKDDWDILNMNEDEEYLHLQILQRLHYKGIKCFYADMWFDDVAYLMGCFENQSKIASALGLHQDSVYPDYEHGLVILNLYQEKHKRFLEIMDRV